MLLLTMGLIAACGDDGEDSSATAGDSGSTDTSTPADEAEGCTADRVGGDLTVGQSGDLRGFDPTVVTGASRDSGGAELTAIYDTLMRSNAETGEVIPHVAESLEPGADASHWTLKLREGVEFGNGDPLTAQTVVDSIKRFEGSNVAAAAFAAQIETTTVVDPLTIEFVLSEPWGDFPYFLASAGGMVVNPAVVEEVGAEQFNLNPPPGAGVGPFELVSYAPGEEVVMKAKSNYWRGPVCIETVRFITPGDDATRYDALRLGEIDVTILFAPRVVAQARDDDGRPGLTGYGNGSQIMFNARPGRPGEDVRVRQAIAAAIDVDLINERVNEGTATATRAIVHPATALYTEGMDTAKHDADLARRLVEEAKAAGWSGELEFLTRDDAAAREIAITVEGMLEAVGMDVNVVSVPTADLIERVIRQQNFDISVWSLNVLPESPWAGIDRNLRSDSPTNRTGYANADFDAALAELRLATTVEGKGKALAALQRIWDETAPGIILQQDEEFLTWGDRVHGVQLTREGVAMLYDVYVD